MTSREASALTLVHFLVAVGLLSFHVHAEASVQDANDVSLLERLTLGPDYFTTMDKVLFAVLIILLMEVLNYLVKMSGSTCMTCCGKMVAYVD